MALNDPGWDVLRQEVNRFVRLKHIESGGDPEDLEFMEEPLRDSHTVDRPLADRSQANPETPLDEDHRNLLTEAITLALSHEARGTERAARLVNLLLRFSR